MKFKIIPILSVLALLVACNDRHLEISPEMRTKLESAKVGSSATVGGLSFESPEIQAIFSKCTACHAPGKPLVALGDWTNYQQVLDKKDRILARAVNEEPSPMPANTPLSNDEKELLKKWFAAGAPEKLAATPEKNKNQESLPEPPVAETPPEPEVPTAPEAPTDAVEVLPIRPLVPPVSAAACFGCHGQNGVSAMPNTPHLAGQDIGYTLSQLEAFKANPQADNYRSNGVMNSMVAALSDEEMIDIAYYFADQALSNNLVEDTDEQRAQIDAGAQQAMTCKACHLGAGNRALTGMPNLAGQRADYLKIQLLNFKNKQRRNGTMNGIAGPLTGEQIDQLAIYFSSLEAPVVLSPEEIENSKKRVQQQKGK